MFKAIAKALGLRPAVDAQTRMEAALDEAFEAASRELARESSNGKS